ncbi:MAG: twin-arginine translocase TatA/TatE family subunit [Chloroflexota bacterium]
MDFFGIGTGEILMILLVALLVVGPNRVVELGRSAGKVVRNIKKASFDLTSTVTKELEEEKSHSPGAEKKD